MYMFPTVYQFNFKSIKSAGQLFVISLWLPSRRNEFDAQFTRLIPVVLRGKALREKFLNDVMLFADSTSNRKQQEDQRTYEEKNKNPGRDLHLQIVMNKTSCHRCQTDWQQRQLTCCLHVKIPVLRTREIFIVIYYFYLSSSWS